MCTDFTREIMNNIFLGICIGVIHTCNLLDCMCLPIASKTDRRHII